MRNVYLMPKVSIVVSVYKMESYLDECVRSLAAQTFSDIEIILVDDGSPDRSGKICDEYAKEDPRITVIHQENQGVSAARNHGMEKAQGEWICFVDADDWIEPDMIEQMVLRAEANDADVVFCAKYSVSQVKRSESRFPLEDGRVLLKKDIMNMVENYLLYLYEKSIANISVPWGKLYRKSLLVDNEVRFPVGMRIREDRIFNLYAFSYADIIEYIDTPLYNHRKSSNVHSRAKYGFSDDSWVESYNKLVIELTKFSKHLSLTHDASAGERVLWIGVIRAFISSIVRYFNSSASALESVRLVKKTAKEKPLPDSLKSVKLKSFPALDMKVSVLFLKLRLYRIYRLMSRGVMRRKSGYLDSAGYS